MSLNDPTLDDLLDEGAYRLLIDGRVYEGVGKSALLALVERGALLGAEQIAEAEGPWMSVREHPAFARLRAAQTRDLHAICGALVAADSQPPSTRPFDLAVFAERAVLAALILALGLLFAIFALIIYRAYF